MPVTLGFKAYPWMQRALAVRRNQPLAYAIAVAVAAFATALAWLLAQLVGPLMPFTAFYPAIMIAAILGGIGPGVAAALLCTAVAWLLLLPPDYAWAVGLGEVVPLVVFICVSAINVAIAVALNAIVDRLLLQQRNIELLLDSAPSGFLLVDDGVIKLANDGSGKVFGYAPRELLGKTVETLVPREQADGHVRLRKAYQQQPEARPMGDGRELNGRRKDGTEVPLEIGLNPVPQAGHSAVLATVVDISGRKHAEAGRRLLVGELQHRTRNLLGVVQALISISAREAKSAPELAKVLLDRVNALGHAQELLPDSNDSISLFKLVDVQGVAHPGGIIVEGQDIELPAPFTEPVVLVLHELVTNALKHGALSVPQGRVMVRGDIDDDGFYVMTWQETGGPPVAAPTHRGFGSIVLERLARQVAERVDIDFAPSGLLYRLYIDREKAEQTLKPAAD